MSLRKKIKESIKGIITEQPTYQSGMYRGVKLYDCSQPYTNNNFFGGLPYPVGQWGNQSNLVYNWPQSLNGNFGTGDCVYLTDSSGTVVDAIGGPYDGLFSNQPITVCYQGNFYSMVGSYGWSNQYPCTTVHNATLVNAGEPPYFAFDPNGPSCANDTCGGGTTGKDEYHMWTECSDFTGQGGSQSMTWSGLPGYVSGADLNNSLIFYDWIDTTIGGISVGDVIKIELATNNQNYTLCLEYDGVTNNVTPVGSWNSPLTIVSSHPDCDDCTYTQGKDEWCCMGGVTGLQQCVQVPIGQCQPGGTGYYGGPFPNQQDCIDSRCGGVDPDERGCMDINALNYNECCSGDPNCVVTISDKECCRYDIGDSKGCMDSAALNYMTCCDPTIPNCIPTGNSPECCRYEGGSEDKGCMDQNALNYNECCNGDPNCTVIGSNPECCRYEDDPDPCKDNPKDCWFCEPGDINTSGWSDPMSLVNANGGCIQFLNTNATFTSGYSGQMFPTQADCNDNTECRPTRGNNEMIDCYRCSNGNPTGNMFPGPNCPSGWESILTFNPKDCKKPLPTNDTPLSEEIKRYKELL